MKKDAQAFTLVEIMLAVTILAAVTTITCMSFGTIIAAWRRGIALTETLHRGDFVAEQLVSALRSVYYLSPRHGFVMEDNGDDPHSSDRISWVKVGTSLVGRNWPASGSPHRVEFWVEEVNGTKHAAVRAWREAGQRDDFDPKKIPPIYLSGDDVITGFNCRVANKKKSPDEEIEWLDNWEETNRVPELIEVTLYLQPLAPGEEPVQLKRLVDIRPLEYGLAARRRGEILQPERTAEQTGRTSGGQGVPRPRTILQPLPRPAQPTGPSPETSPPQTARPSFPLPPVPGQPSRGRPSAARK